MISSFFLYYQVFGSYLFSMLSDSFQLVTFDIFPRYWISWMPWKIPHSFIETTPYTFFFSWYKSVVRWPASQEHNSEGVCPWAPGSVPRGLLILGRSYALHLQKHLMPQICFPIFKAFWHQLQSPVTDSALLFHFLQTFSASSLSSSSQTNFTKRENYILGVPGNTHWK